MFFKKKKSKLDPKVRFQNRQFNQKLQQARTFKRNVRPVPEGGFSKFLIRIKLGTSWRQIGIALLVLAILYVIYFPNFLSVQAIHIEGVKESDQASIEARLRDNLGKVPFYNPQRNIVFLSKARVESVLRGFSVVDSIDSIQKNYKDKSLTIVLKPKIDRFLVRTNDKVFLLYNDGTYDKELGTDRSAWDNNPNTHLIKIDVPAIVHSQDTQFLSSDAVKYLTVLTGELQGIVGSNLGYLDFPLSEAKRANATPVPQNTVTLPAGNPQNSTTTKPDAIDKLVSEENSVSNLTVEIQTPIALGELNIFMQKGTQPGHFFKVLVDPTENPNDVVQRLNLLLSQTAVDRYNSLDYIDLRIKNRAFVCLIGAVCSN